jgi:hypothetical protein
MIEYHNHTHNPHNPHNMCVLKVQSPRDFDLAIEHLKNNLCYCVKFYCILTQKQVQTFADLLQTDTNIREVYFLHTQVVRYDDEGLDAQDAKILTKALKVNKTLTQLCLVENNIRDEGVEALVKAIRVNPTLKVLDVRMNNLTRRGFELLTNQLYNHRPRMSIRYGELENN